MLSQNEDENLVRALYQGILDGWNKQQATGMADLFAPDGSIVGFDGSQINGRQEIESTMNHIFTNHKTPPYISIIREVRFLAPEVALLRAVVGMVPPGKTELDPNLNAIQALVAVKQGKWFAALFQNTPAAYHGRPQLVELLTDELQRALEQSKR